MLFTYMHLETIRKTKVKKRTNVKIVHPFFNMSFSDGK